VPQTSGLFQAVKHKANLSLDVIFACKNSARVIQPAARLRETLTGSALGLGRLDGLEKPDTITEPQQEKVNADGSSDTAWL
jgi:hypothetical protein